MGQSSRGELGARAMSGAGAMSGARPYAATRVGPRVLPRELQKTDLGKPGTTLIFDPLGTIPVTEN